MEITFFDERVTPENARLNGHIHIEDVAAHADLFENEHILVMHLSNRHTPQEFRRCNTKTPSGRFVLQNHCTSESFSISSTQRKIRKRTTIAHYKMYFCMYRCPCFCDFDIASEKVTHKLPSPHTRHNTSCAYSHPE